MRDFRPLRRLGYGFGRTLARLYRHGLSWPTGRSLARCKYTSNLRAGWPAWLGRLAIGGMPTCPTPTYLMATFTGALSKPATLIVNGTASPGEMPFGTYAFTWYSPVSPPTKPLKKT